VVGWSLLFFVAPFLAVFYNAVDFNQDVSKWNTGAVTNMYGSKCTFSPFLLWPQNLVVCWLNIYTTTRGSSGHKSHTLCSFLLFVVLKRNFLLLFVWFFVAPITLRAVFYDAAAFNQTVSNWNTGAVTTMERSKCIHVLSLA
jgi:surface protein